MVLYVLARVADIKFESAVQATAPFLIPLGIVLLLITYVPAVSMWLPELLYR
jgi:TRAP-type C4-dicarboxylate transport system permease large subunit